jgi:chromosome segregation ATPase
VHILTKVLVVVAAVLSVFLSTLVIAYSLNAGRIVADYQFESNRRAAAEARLASDSATNSDERSRLQRQAQSLTDSNTSLMNQLRDLQRDNARLLGEKNAAEQERQSIQLKIAELGETVKTQTALLRAYSGEVTSLRSGEIQFRQQKLELEDRISDLESQRDVLDQNLRKLREQLAEAQQSLAQGQGAAGVVRASSSEDRPFEAAAVLNGRVESLDTDKATGATLVKINLGTADKLVKNTQLYAVRNNQFVANLVVIESDLKFSICRVDTLGRTVEVQAGDLVMSRLSR